MPELSPAAAAIARAFDDRFELCGPFDDGWHEECLAAALEALADQDETLFDENEELMPAVRAVRTDRILAIAAELRGGEADG